MKKRIIGLSLALVISLSGVAAAAGGTASDSLISRSYLEGTFLEGLQTSVADGVSRAAKAIYEEAARKLEQVATAHLTSLGADPGENNSGSGWSTSLQFTAQGGEREDTVTLSVGSGIVWTSGSASVSGVLVDATDGVEVLTGGALQAGHRYLAGEQTVITVTSQTAHWAVEGLWMTTSDGISVKELPFTDVPEGSWYYDAVCYVYEHSLYQGTSATEFSPLMYMQRGMMTTVLHRLAGSPAVTYTPIFTDVPAGTWYTDGTIWAGQNAVVSGAGDGTFLPGRNVERQQIAVILYNYARFIGCDISGRGSLTAFSDGGSVATWAQDAVSWAVSVGILQGSNGKVMPNNSATRAEVAIMLQRFQTWVEKTA